MDDTVLHELVQLAKSSRNELAKELAKVDLYIGQEQVLLALWRHDGLSQAELAERVQAVPPTVTKMLQRMERGGLVRRERADGRGRVSRVFLTEAGRALRADIERLWAVVESRLTARLDDRERAALRHLLRKAHGRTEPATMSGMVDYPAN
ncbi:MarR family transcriptional regulator [Actinokineospora sp. NBRC 105648]|uniref:MarR family winged helix-turn-helix transcriptional regulator n=1 Tax=Actinokineospora sp. NBRC 105648 TaxID=3032206 RepID=UPI0025547E1E|nr:MarR family transcriptional regulator [Actinokineospora sp. NBRC 105648]